jgi:hypothetical protein
MMSSNVLDQTVDLLGDRMEMGRVLQSSSPYFSTNILCNDKNEPNAFRKYPILLYRIGVLTHYCI